MHLENSSHVSRALILVWRPNLQRSGTDEIWYSGQIVNQNEDEDIRDEGINLHGRRGLAPVYLPELLPFGNWPLRSSSAICWSNSWTI